MFKVKKATPAGQCRAMRCTISDQGENKLCSRHEIEWTEAGCPDLDSKPVPSSVEVPDVSEVVDQELILKDLDITEQDELNAVVEILHEAVDKKEALDETRSASGKEHYQAWKAIQDSFRPAIAAYDSLIQTIKSRIVARQKSIDEAIDNGKPVPPPLENPPGLSIKPEIKVVVAAIEKVPEEFLKVVIDTDAVMEAVGKDFKLEIPGLVIASEYKVTYRRPNGN